MGSEKVGDNSRFKSTVAGGLHVPSSGFRSKSSITFEQGREMNPTADEVNDG